MSDTVALNSVSQLQRMELEFPLKGQAIMDEHYTKLTLNVYSWAETLSQTFQSYQSYVI